MNGHASGLGQAHLNVSLPWYRGTTPYFPRLENSSKTLAGKRRSTVEMLLQPMIAAEEWAIEIDTMDVVHAKAICIIRTLQHLLRRLAEEVRIADMAISIRRREGRSLSRRDM